MQFSTSDNDNDDWGGNCAAYQGAANWWKYCGHNNMNGKYGGNGDIGVKLMYWWYFDNNFMSLISMSLMLRPAV